MVHPGMYNVVSQNTVQYSNPERKAFTREGVAWFILEKPSSLSAQEYPNAAHPQKLRLKNGFEEWSWASTRNPSLLFLAGGSTTLKHGEPREA